MTPSCEPNPRFYLSTYSQKTDLQHRNTFVRAHRPYGVSCLIAGFNYRDGKPAIYVTKPSGVVQEWLGVGIGEHSEVINHRLEAHQKELKGMDASQLARLAARAIMDAKGDPSTSIEIEVLLMTKKGKETEEKDRKGSPSIGREGAEVQIERMLIKSREEADRLLDFMRQKSKKAAPENMKDEL